MKKIANPETTKSDDCSGSEPYIDLGQDKLLISDLARLCTNALETGFDVEAAQRLISANNIAPPKAASVLENWPWPLRVYSLGQFSIQIDGRPLQFLGKAPIKQLQLLKVLVAFGETDVSKEQLTQILWPDSEGDDAQRALSTTLYRLRQLVGSSVVNQSQGKLSLSQTHCWTDKRCMDAYLLEASQCIKQNKLAEAWSNTDKALALYRGPFYSYGSSSWELSVSERIRRKLLNHIDQLGTQLIDNHYYELAIQAYMKGIEIDELQEMFYQGAIRCYKQMGCDAEAYSIYKQCKTVLTSVLGIMPGAQTLELINSSAIQTETSVPNK